MTQTPSKYFFKIKYNQSSLGTDHLTSRGGYGFFSKINILIPSAAEKNILILVEEKKSDSEFLSYNLMLNSGGKNSRDKKKNILNFRVVRKKKFLNETKNHNPPCTLQVKWSVPYVQIRL